MDAANGFPTNSSGFMLPQHPSGAQVPLTGYPATGADGQPLFNVGQIPPKQTYPSSLLRSNSAVP